MAWVEGILIERDKEGRVLVGDDVAHEEAERAMDAGETIGLTARGKIVTYMSLVDGGYEEVRE